jgi:hypothetical protein
VSAVAAGRDMPEVRTSTVADTLTKSDRLPVLSSIVPVAVEPQHSPEPPPMAVPKIITRHWHDPSDPRAAKGATKKPKSMDPKKHARRVERKLTPQACSPMRAAHSGGSSAQLRFAAID